MSYNQDLKAKLIELKSVQHSRLSKIIGITKSYPSKLPAALSSSKTLSIPCKDALAGKCVFSTTGALGLTGYSNDGIQLWKDVDEQGGIS